MVLGGRLARRPALRCAAGAGLPVTRAGIRDAYRTAYRDDTATYAPAGSARAAELAALSGELLLLHERSTATAYPRTALRTQRSPLVAAPLAVTPANRRTGHTPQSHLNTHTQTKTTTCVARDV